MMKKADIIVDLQYGSTGKGAIAGYLAKMNDYDTVVSSNRPNAGHTFIDERGNVMIHKVLPNGVVGENVDTVLIGGGAVFCVKQLMSEISVLDGFGYNNFMVYIHESATILNDEHRAAEGEYDRIGSTQQGAAAAIINKMERDPENDPTAKRNPIDHPQVVVVSNAQYASLVAKSKNMLLEGAQGYSLGIDAGFWPYCTSRNCTVNQTMSDMGIPHSFLRKVIGCARTYPIRVAGTSGPHYPDQRELTWKEVGQEEELTTVTQRVRRVFTFSDMQVKDAIFANQVDEVFLNFCNYMTGDMDCLKDIVATINEALNELTGNPLARVKYTGWGPGVHDIVEEN